MPAFVVRPGTNRLVIGDIAADSAWLHFRRHTLAQVHSEGVAASSTPDEAGAGHGERNG